MPAAARDQREAQRRCAPVFSPDGKYLYFLSARHENPVPSDNEFNFAVVKSAGIYVIPLTRDGASPFARAPTRARWRPRRPTTAGIGSPAPASRSISTSMG
ncbi:MAG: hypothetical protein WDN04_07440 [Rhodospirillales bacterium]